ncbi:helicase-associated domain-containing protein [Cellulomonas dongxiuzhuiae]|uniref:Helicase C-terminal domain-containing protein n=1 Tax=Cellulomonas dongxiuzhuiae TaxID=2819979 RepID=A0ABX8GLC0_9CELL|nr:helicase-associated domain-containing protein [Cellulomonas dongxiuzhuiae]MBO3096328.1 helicase-associated domain-containing protein [Cellulomonas dongxiuzhuiae]QWC16743.1 helicase C-terminal domain-containing protein [Cellulomonas dongxiuzhuiae]
MATFTGYLRARSDDELVALLVRRPDLATPHPATMASLAARATSRSSLDRALTWVDALVLQVLEAVVVLTPRTGAPSRQDVLTAVGAGPDDASAVTRALDDAVALLLLWPDDDGALHPAPGLVDALGGSVAGLAPGTEDVDGPGGPTGPATGDDGPLAVLADAPPAAGPVLDALTWGPPVGLVPPPGTTAADAVTWLLAHGLLVRGDGRHVLLPRDVALALRGGRTHRAPALAPTSADAPVRDPQTVAAESARAAEHTVRLVRQLLTRWEQSPPHVLRGGGLGARDLRRTAQGLDVDDAHAAWLVETAAAAGLLADDGEETPSFVPTLEADAWSAQDVAPRWGALARAWLASARTPWLVGARDERGALRAALDPELSRPWVPRLRRAVLDVLAAAPVGAGLSAADVHAALQWRSPRSVPPLSAVEAVLTDATRLGVLGAGALAAAGRALLAGDDAVEALAADLPAPVEEILLQGDLTGVVPGRPGADLEDLLDLAAVVESRGGAVTVRFTADSVLRALDAGTTADDLLSRLSAAARGRVPQPLEYLVRDVARRHGRLRAGAASSYVRADDPALLAGLADDPHLASLRLRLLAPTVLVADASPSELLAALRARGLAPVAEDAQGSVVHAVAPERRVRARAARTSPVRERPLPERAASVVATLRRGDVGEPASRTPDARHATDAPGSYLTRSVDVAHATAASRRARAPRTAEAAGPGRARAAGGTSEPADLLVVLREAAQARTSVWVEMVGPDGRSQRRLVRPLRVEGGRLRALDPQREAELTVAVHRIAGVEPADTPAS